MDTDHPGTIAVENPATLDIIGHVPDGDADDARGAVDRAYGALRPWSERAPRARSEILHRVHALMMRDEDELAGLISRENGKSLDDARVEVAYAAEFFRWYAEEAVRTEGSYGMAPAGGCRTVVTHGPVGVAALVTPWNFPAAMVTRKVAPALAAGCTAVLKPAAETPLTALAIAELLVEAGAPADVLTLVTTTDPAAVVDNWLADPRVRKLSFTGSTRVGRGLLASASAQVLNCSMELGGNAPFIVLPDADLDAAVSGAMVAKFRNGGAACTAANRFYVHADVHDEFVARFGERLSALVLGDAFDGATIGPMISRRERDRVVRLVDAAVSEGARISHRGDSAALPGHFHPPTLLVDVAPSAAILRQEIFGPVAPVVVWKHEQDLVEQANATEHGLAAYVFGGDLGRVIAVAESLEAGMVGVNRGTVSDPSAPFGGVKQSGLGREGARQGMREFQETQMLSISMPPAGASM